MNFAIGDNIKILRKKKGVSQEKLAQEFGISIQAVSKWETGNAFPDLLLLPDIAKYFDVSIDYLFYSEKSHIADQLFHNLDSNLIKEDDTLRVVQCIGKKIVKQEEYNEKKHLF